jgi:tetratricopeptide (TPR) repeat protein
MRAVHRSPGGIASTTTAALTVGTPFSRVRRNGVGMGVLVLALGLALTAAANDPLPDPLSGPGHPELSRAAQKRLDKAKNSLARGKTAAVEKALRKAGSSEAVTLFRLQMDLMSDAQDPTPALQELVDQHDGYAAAWITLSIAAERSGDEAVAYRAATRAAELWPGSTRSLRLEQFDKLWIEDRVDLAQRRLADGAPDEALEPVDHALALAPDHPRGLLVRARAMVSLDRLDEAEEVLLRLPGDARAQMLYGRIAELRRDWQIAMDRYQEVPPDTPGRAEALSRAQLRWRLSMLPRYVQRAMTSEKLTRADLAVIVVALVPQIEAIGGGRVRLLTDIVDLESQREIVTVARLDLMTIDPLEHRFNPTRVVTADEVRAALDRLGTLLGLPSPSWCAVATVVSSNCTNLSEPIRGEDVANLVLGMAYGNSR